MAALRDDHLDRNKARKGPNQGQKFRVIAKIRGFTHLEAESDSGVLVPWIAVHKPKGDDSDSVTITFGDQSASHKDSYQVDFCYEQNEGNGVVFSREVKPLISGVFDGRNATVIAYGARGSGKTYMIKGTNEEQGLAVLAMAEILRIAENREKSITMSFYEVFQEHVYDLLDPRRPEVSVLENAQGKVQLKGLSQAPVTSMSEFHKLCSGGHSSHKAMQKMAAELLRRSHRGIMVHVSSPGEKSNPVFIAKLNLIDLAGYEDARRKSIGGLNLAENTKINKSIHAIKNVVYSLNANESHVPYRECKLTHMLRDSLGGTSIILMVACLNPSFCQDSMYMVRLMSRQGTSRAVLDSSKKTNSSLRPVVPTSVKSRTIQSVSATAKKKTVPRAQFSEKKANCVASTLKTRKLFDEAHQLKSEKTSCLDVVSTAEYSSQEGEKKVSSDDVKQMVPLEVEDLSSAALEDASSVSVVETSPVAVDQTGKTIASCEDNFFHGKDSHEEITPITKELFVVEEGKNMDKENSGSLANEVASPPISAQLQELSNNLKQLYFSTPKYAETTPKVDTSLCSQATTDFVEPRTPDQSSRVNNTQEVANFCSPWQTFSVRSSGVKNNLVEEYLRFLNTADKEDLKKLKGIGEKRATYILGLREESTEPFKSLDDLKDIGLSAKQIKGMIEKQVGGLFN